ncbi:hypothetical protein U1Q18_025189 [Sarracenia purpurea var. burkii]
MPSTFSDTRFLSTNGSLSTKMSPNRNPRRIFSSACHRSLRHMGHRECSVEVHGDARWICSVIYAHSIMLGGQLGDISSKRGQTGHRGTEHSSG